MSEYKTFEELKEELGDKFEDYMYKANIELLNKLQQKENIIKEVREYIESKEYVRYGIIEVDEMKIRKILKEGEQQ